MKTVTFDFDHTLLFEIGEPNEEGLRLFREHMAAGDEIHVVTSRHSINSFMMSEITDFLQEHDLVAESVVFTEGQRKVEHLQKLGCQLHFDDDPFEISACEEAGIEAVRLFNMDKWNEYMDVL